MRKKSYDEVEGQEAPESDQSFEQNIMVYESGNTNKHSTTSPFEAKDLLSSIVNRDYKE